MMSKFKFTVNVLICLVICYILLSFNLVSFYTINRKFDSIHILSLYINFTDPDKITEFKEMWMYNTKLTYSLEVAITRILSDLGVHFNIMRYEVGKNNGDLNKTWLDSFDIILVGGLAYWKHYVSAECINSLLQTLTPIIASVYGGEVNPSLLKLNNMMGVSRINATNRIINGKISVEFSNEIFGTHTIILGWGTVVNAHSLNNSNVYAYGIIDDTKVPLLVFNGTKNFLINLYAYSQTLDRWLPLIFICLNELFDFMPKTLLVNIIFQEENLFIFKVFNSVDVCVNQTIITPTLLFFLLLALLNLDPCIKVKKLLNKSKSRIKIFMDIKTFNKIFVRFQGIVFILFIFIIILRLILVDILNLYYMSLQIMVTQLASCATLNTVILGIINYFYSDEKTSES